MDVARTRLTRSTTSCVDAKSASGANEDPSFTSRCSCTHGKSSTTHGSSRIPRTKSRATEQGLGSTRHVRRSAFDGVDVRRHMHASVRFLATRLPSRGVRIEIHRPSTPSMPRVPCAIAPGASTCPIVPFRTVERPDRRPVQTRILLA